MIKVLILGGLGFLGKQISTYLKNEGFEVIIFSRSFDPKFKNVKVDVSDLKEFELEFNRCNPDLVIDLINTQGIKKTEEDYMKSYNTNIISLKNIIYCCNKNKTPIIYFSSAAVYGIPEKTPILESGELNPVNLYGFFKYFCENLIKSKCSEYKINYTIFRIFNIYTNEKGFGFINTIFDSIKKGITLNVYGINQKRDYIHIDDLLLLIKKTINNSKMENKLINVGSGIGYSTKDLIEIFLKYKKFQYNIISMDTIEYDSVANISNLKKLYGFSPLDIKFELEERLKK